MSFNRKLFNESKQLGKVVLILPREPLQPYLDLFVVIKTGKMDIFPCTCAYSFLFAITHIHLVLSESGGQDGGHNFPHTPIFLRESTIKQGRR